MEKRRIKFRVAEMQIMFLLHKLPFILNGLKKKISAKEFKNLRMKFR